LGWSR